MVAGLSTLEPVEASLQEAWGEPVHWSEYPQSEAWDRGETGYVGQQYTTIDDRKDGRWRPYYETEDDLARQRMIARKMAIITSTRWASMEALRYYAFGTGPEIKAVAAKGQDRNDPAVSRLLSEVNDVIRRFIDDNEFTGSLDYEMHDRSREDGETLITLEACNNRILASFVEPDQLTEPRSPSQLYDWLEAQYGIDCGAFVPRWKFGVLCPVRRPEQVAGYHVVYDGIGRDWDFVPTWRAEHIKRNVGRAAPRGVSDFLPVWQDMQAESKLSRNVVQGAALQAAIAWVEEMPAGTTEAQAAGIGRTDVSYQKPTGQGAGGGTRTQRVTRYGPGSILRPSAGRSYKPGPMGSERNPGFVLAAQYIFRRMGIRWSMPEYMISGDASNANYASTLVAESPFVKAREADQQFYGRSIRSLVWKAVRLAKEIGLLKTTLPFSVVRELVEITVNWPSVATRNPTELVARLKSEVEMGVTSLRTAATELDRDYDEEIAAGAKPAAVGGFAFGSPSGGEAVGQTLNPSPVPTPADGEQAVKNQDAAAEVGKAQDAALNGAQVQSLIQIVSQVATGQMPLATAQATIAASFPLLTPQQITDITAPLAGFRPDPKESVSAVSESVLEAARQAWGGYP